MEYAIVGDKPRLAGEVSLHWKNTWRYLYRTRLHWRSNDDIKLLVNSLLCNVYLIIMYILDGKRGICIYHINISIVLWYYWNYTNQAFRISIWQKSMARIHLMSCLAFQINHSFSRTHRTQSTLVVKSQMYIWHKYCILSSSVKSILPMTKPLIVFRAVST